MADCGFDIQDDRTLINVKLNIPPFLKDKDQFTEVEMVQTWRIASLRIPQELEVEVGFSHYLMLNWINVNKDYGLRKIRFMINY